MSYNVTASLTVFEEISIWRTRAHTEMGEEAMEGNEAFEFNPDNSIHWTTASSSDGGSRQLVTAVGPAAWKSSVSATLGAHRQVLPGGSNARHAACPAVRLPRCSGRRWVVSEVH